MKDFKPLVNEGRQAYAAADYRRALACYLQAEQIMMQKPAKNTANLCVIAQSIGGVYIQTKEYEMAFAYFTKAYQANLKEFGPAYERTQQCQKAMDALKNQIAQGAAAAAAQRAAALINEGFAAFRAGEQQRAIGMYLEAEAILAQTPDKNLNNRGLVYGNLAEAYVKLNEEQRALEYFTMAYEIALKEPGPEDQRTQVYHRNIGILKTRLERGPQGQRAADLIDEGVAAYRAGQNERAIGLYLEAEAILAQTPDKNLSDRALLYGNLAEAYIKLNDERQALDCYTKAYAFALKESGQENQRTWKYYRSIGILKARLERSFEKLKDGSAADLFNRGCDHGSAGEYQQAIDCFLQAEAIFRQNGDCVRAASALSYIGLAYTWQKDKKKATEWYLKAAEAREPLEEDLDAAAIYEKTGQAYGDQYEREQALHWYRKAHEAKKKLLGEEHPDTLAVYINIAKVLFNKYERETALEMLLWILEVRERTLGKEHPDTIAVCDEIASVCSYIYKYDQSIEFYSRILATTEKIKGKEHADAAEVCLDLGLMYDRKSEYDMALSWYFRALAIREKALGPEHAITAGTYNKIGWIYGQKNEYDKSLEWYLKGLAICEKTQAHRQAESICYNIADLYGRRQGNHEKEIEWRLKEIESKEKRLGSDPDVALSYSTLAVKYDCNLHDYEKALECFMKAYKIYLAVHGPKDSDTKNTYEELEAMHGKLGLPKPFGAWLSAQLN